MSGGKGSRFNQDKPLANVCDSKNLINLITISKHLTNRVYVATTYSHPVTRFLKALNPDVQLIYTRGEGYEKDILEVVNILKVPILILPADIYLNSEILLQYLILSCTSDICNLVFNDNYVGISFWKGYNYSNYENIGIKIYPLTFNNFEEYIKVAETCKKQIS
ncbi:MAG: NTP transferase domain-containing protein [Sulfolobaceae archaeon]|nr:NTP transferase domain-containing protein [Sulfolobaceae archaeon]